MNFANSEKVRMKAKWNRQFRAEDMLPSGYQLKSRSLNFLDASRDLSIEYFQDKNVVWHLHSNHALSSQVACLNFLMPLAIRPHLLANCIASALGEPIEEMLPVESTEDGTPLFVGFEWPGLKDYLGESSGKDPRRGANATNADAIVRFKAGGKIETVLIEWKYTESYGATQQSWSDRNHVRRGRYEDRAFAPDGPIRGDCGLEIEDFFHEPVYQMLRQQMLAWQMEKAQENDASRVRVLHISPTENLALHRMTAPALPVGDIFKVFQSLLIDPESFCNVSTTKMFAPLLTKSEADGATQDWINQLVQRYPFAFPDLSESTEKLPPR
ncbi:hypothetical protein [Sulfitobacter sp. CW3]|uniref:PGN_0703 family putative restriction endonuclease n=1 Tax=Sulfitobacter sp. CW3 TaxID=2861965 RepID=UPI001C603728|nr:hypothetical protein [Sulfitobacter sp. CW3]MBW4962846.1 hypothetical protein [Sulfitobacter sp. CW3]